MDASLKVKKKDKNVQRGHSFDAHMTEGTQVYITCLMFLEALMISLMRGTPRVMFMDATPAKWKVFRVI